MPSHRWYPSIHTWLGLGGRPRSSTTMRGGAMRTTTSAASGLRASAPAKTNPINRLGNITRSPILKCRTTNESKRHVRPSSSPPNEGTTWTQLHRSSSFITARAWPRANAQHATSRLRGHRQNLHRSALFHWAASPARIPDKALESRAGRVGISHNGGNREVL